MNDHSKIVEYLEAKGEGSWRVGITATEAIRRMRSRPAAENPVPALSASGARMSVADALNQADLAEDGEMTWEAAKVLAAEVRRLSKGA